MKEAEVLRSTLIIFGVRLRNGDFVLRVTQVKPKSTDCSYVRSDSRRQRFNRECSKYETEELSSGVNSYDFLKQSTQ